MATFTKRQSKIGVRWEARIRKMGYPTQTRTFSYKTDAVEWAGKIERQIERGVFTNSKHARVKTFGEILERYSEEVTPQKRGASSEKTRIQKMLRHSISKIGIGLLQSSHIAEYRDQRLVEVSPGSVCRELSIMSAALTVAIREWGYAIPNNPVKQIKRPTEKNSRSRRLTDDEEKRLLSTCGQSSNRWLLPLVKLAIETGMRRSEMLSLMWDGVHLESRYVHITNTKNRENRDVPLSSTAVALLEDLSRTDDDIHEPVFPIHFEALKSAWKRVCDKAEISDLRFHDLRHEATSRFFEKGLNVMEVAAITGHKDLRMLQRYTHLKAADLAMKLG